MDVLHDNAEVGRRVSAVGGIYAGDGDHQGQLEDDVFYAELVRQVLILTADDDDSSVIHPHGHRNNNFGYGDSMSQPGSGSWLSRSDGHHSGDSVPITWPAVSQGRLGGGSSGGTGVFIPLTTGKSRRKSGNGKRGSKQSKQQQEAQKTAQNKH